MNAQLYLTAALKLAPTIIQLGGDIEAFAVQVYKVTVSSADPTPDDWAALDALEKTLRDQLNG